MEEELKSLSKVGVSTIISTFYCYYLLSRIKVGVLRLVFVFPVCAIFLVFPMFFTFSIFSSTIAFFLSGMANLKLILLCFDQGPLFPLPSNLFRFTCFTCLPIQLMQNPRSHSSPNHFSKWVFATKVAIFAMLIHLYIYKPNLPSSILMGLHPLYIYLSLEILLTLLNFLFTIILGCELKPQFNEPYLATSLHDFWGHRWNLIVTGLLLPAVYTPVRRVCNRLMNSDWARFLGFFATFLVSGLFHELLYFYITREHPTWEVTWFFVVNGFSTAMEVAVKKTKFGQQSLVRPVVSRLLTMGFLVATGYWLFLPQFIRFNLTKRCADETLLLIDFFRRKFFYL